MQEIQVNIIDLIILFGVFQGAILAIVLLTTRRLQRRSNTFLAILLLVFSLVNLGNLSHNVDSVKLILGLPLFYFTLIPVSLYFFVLYLIRPNYQFQRRDALLFVLPALEIAHQFSYAIQYFWTGELQLEGFWNYKNINNLFELIALPATLYVIFHAIQQLKAYEKDLYDNYAEVEEKNLAWLRHTLLCGLGLVFIWMLVLYFDFQVSKKDMIFPKMAWIGLTIMICWIGYSMIIRQGLLDSPVFGIIDTTTKDTPPPKIELSSKTDEHYKNILDLFEADKIYKDSNLNLTILAEKAGLSKGYVSQIINQKRKQNFFEFVNAFRVEDVKQAMLHPASQHLSILGIAQNAGFKSKSTFNAVFKKTTGMTPSEYRKSVG